MTKKIIPLLIFILLSHASFAKQNSNDPNSYFREKNWSVDVSPTSYVYAKSIYRGEPVQKPNKLIAELHCRKPKRTLPVISSLTYCGIDSIIVIGGRLEIMFSDFNYKDSKGYCTKKRKQYFSIPSCNQKIKKASKKNPAQ